MPPPFEQLTKPQLSSYTDVKVRRFSKVTPISTSAPLPSVALVGTHKLLVVLVETAETKWPAKYTVSRYRELVFSKTSLSLREYFRENSYGKFDVTGEVVGPVRVSGRLNDYAFKIGQNSKIIQDLVEKAVRASSQKINLKKFDDYNLRGRPEPDGIIDHVMIIYPATSNDAQSFSPIWPHRGTADIDIGVTRVAGYTIVNHSAPLGVLVHEFAHDLGLPDLYDRDFSSYGVGRWTLMGSGGWAKQGTLPSHISAWGKAKLGWLSPQIVSNEFTELKLESSSEKPSALRLPIGSVNSSEYFLIENRRKVGFDRRIPAEGIVIWHIDESRSNNDNEKHKMVDVVEAAPVQDLDQRIGGKLPEHSPDVFHKGNKSLFNDDTTPSARTFAGAPTNIEIEVLSPPSRKMSIKIRRPKIFNPGGVPFVLENDSYRYGRYSVVPTGKGSEALARLTTTPGGYLVYGAQIFFVGPKNTRGRSLVRVYEDNKGKPGNVIVERKIKLRTPPDGYLWKDVPLASNSKGLKLNPSKNYWIGVTTKQGKIYPGLNPQSSSRNSYFRRKGTSTLVDEFNFATGREPVSDYIMRLTGFGYVNSKEKPAEYAKDSDPAVLQFLQAESLASAEKWERASELLAEVRETMDRTPRKYDNWLPAVTNSSGVCAYKLKNYAVAIEFFRASLRRIQSMGDADVEADIFQNLAEASFHTGRFKDAKTYAERARRINYRRNRHDYIVENTYWLGRITDRAQKAGSKGAERWYDMALDGLKKAFPANEGAQKEWRRRIERAREGQAKDEDRVADNFRKLNNTKEGEVQQRKVLDLLQYLQQDANE